MGSHSLLNGKSNNIMTGNRHLPTNFGTGSNIHNQIKYMYTDISGSRNQFGNRTENHQFGKNNPNSKRNLALMGAHQKKMQQLPQQQPQQQQPPQQPPQQQPQQPPVTSPTRAPQFVQLTNAINCAYKNGCFGQYSNQIYNMLIIILNRLPSYALFTLQDAAYSLYNKYANSNNYYGLFSNVGALWANLPSNKKNAIANGINCGLNNQCISQNAYNMLQKLLSILNSYSGPPQTASSMLTNDYSKCMANSSNSSVCNYFTEANNALLLGNQYISGYQYNLDDYYI